MNRVKLFLAGVGAVVLLSVALVGCGGGGKNINNADDLKTYLNSRPANGPDKPIRVAIKVNEQMIPSIRDVIQETHRYVSLNLTGSPLTEIPDYAFGRRGCSNLVGITIPNRVTRIGKRAFENCQNLVSVNIPNSVTAIGESAFANCTNITRITIPNSVKEIHGSAFSGWTSSQTIDVPFANQAAADAAWSREWGLSWQTELYWCHEGVVNNTCGRPYFDAKINYAGR